MATIQPSVAAAFRDAGDSNAVTPFEIASVPVMAAQPSAKPRSSRYINAKPVIGESAAGAAGLPLADAATTVGMWPDCIRYRPVPISQSIITMNAYVGKLKASPDSRTPRRLTTVTRMMDA